MAAPSTPGWQAYILQRLGAPVTSENLRALNAWAQAEGGGAANNPFNTTMNGFGATGSYNSVGVKNYSNVKGGLDATVATLQNGRYAPIVNALRQGNNAMAVAQGISATPWGTGPLVERVLSGGGGQVDPVTGKFERVDQGVDYMASKPVGAFGSGVITSITKGMAGGTGDIIKERLDKPVTVNGRTYNQIYYSEESPLVKAGQRVGLNQAVMQAGGNEIGFLNQDGQMAPLVGGLGAGTKPTQMGQDFLDFVNGRGGLGGASGSLPQPQPQRDLRQHIVAQKVGVLGGALGTTLLASAQSLLAGGSPNMSNLFTLAKGFQQARKAVAPLGGTQLAQAAGSQT